VRPQARRRDPSPAATADGASAASPSGSGTSTDGAAAASAPEASASAASAGPPAGEGAAAIPRNDPTASPEAAPFTGELELTLVPHRVESGILMVEASLRRGRAPGQGTATLVQRTHAVTPNSSFDITLKGPGPGAEGSYKFTVQSRF
jgi:hypothetical protein